MLKVEKAIKKYGRVSTIGFWLAELDVVNAGNVLFEIHR